MKKFPKVMNHILNRIAFFHHKTILKYFYNTIFEYSENKKIDEVKRMGKVKKGVFDVVMRTEFVLMFNLIATTIKNSLPF